MSRREDYEKQGEELLMPILKENGFELVDLEYVKEGSEYYLRAYIDKPGGIDVLDCEKVSRAYSPLLDKKDFIPDPYILEISSPGLGRPLKKDKDFNRNIGKDIEFRSYKAIDGKKEFLGTLTEYDSDTFTVIKENGESLKYNRKDMSLIREYVEW